MLLEENDERTGHSSVRYEFDSSAQKPIKAIKTRCSTTQFGCWLQFHYS